MRERRALLPLLFVFTACGTSDTPAGSGGPDASGGSGGATMSGAGGNGTGGGTAGGAGTGGTGGAGGVSSAGGAGGAAGGAGGAAGGAGGAAGSSDAGPPPCMPVADRVVSDSAGVSGRPSIAWNGSGYAIAFPDDRGGTTQIHLALLDARGVKMGTDLPITSGSRAAGLPDLVYDGSGYGLSYTTEMPAPPMIHFARLSAVGAVMGRVLDVGDGGGINSLVWTGKEYGLAHNSGRNVGFVSDIYFARIDTMAALIGTELRVTDDPGSEFIPTAAWNGTNYGMVFLHGAVDGGTPGGIYFAGVDSNGVEIGNEALIPNANGGQARLAASPTGYAMTWRSSDTMGTLTRLDSSGKRTAAADLTLPRGPADVIWGGTRYAAAWSLTSATAGGEVFLQTYPAADGAAGPLVMVSSGGVAEVNSISIAWNGSGYGVAWADSRTMPAEIHFAAVCP